MGNVANTYTYTGLTSTGSPTSEGVAGSFTLGQKIATTTLTGADIFYTVKVTSTGGSDVATLTLSSGSVAQTTGTPTILDGDGEDFEGVTLGTMATLQGVYISTGSVESGTIQVADSGSLIDVTADSDASVFQVSAPNGHAITSQTLVITFDTTAQDVTVIVAGKTT